MAETNAVSQAEMHTLKTVTTGMLRDALAISGIQAGITGVRPARGFEDAKVVGPAVTALFAPGRPETPSINNYRVIRQSPPGSVLVIDGGGMDAFFTGDNQGEAAKRQGLAGVVVYGGARDVAGFRQVGMPLYYKGPAVNSSGWRLTAYNIPIEVGGALVKPGDIIVADEDGVIAIPREALATVMENLKTILYVEDSMEKAIRSDASVEEISAILAKKRPRQ